MKEAAMEKAKIFWSGRSQAVRLPKQFRLPGHEALVSRRGSAVVLEPLADDWAWLDAVTGKLDPDVLKSAREKSPQQRRPAPRKLFR
jgi:antitoxin VapB